MHGRFPLGARLTRLRAAEHPAQALISSAGVKRKSAVSAAAPVVLSEFLNIIKTF